MNPLSPPEQRHPRLKQWNVLILYTGWWEVLWVTLVKAPWGLTAIWTPLFPSILFTQLNSQNNSLSIFQRRIELQLSHSRTPTGNILNELRHKQGECTPCPSKQAATPAACEEHITRHVTVHFFWAHYICLPSFVALKLPIRMFNDDDRKIGAVEKLFPPTCLLVTYKPLKLHLWQVCEILVSLQA